MNEQELNNMMVSNSDRRYSRLYQENTLFTNRLSVFFIAESMLFIAFFSAINLFGNTAVSNIDLYCLLLSTSGLAITVTFTLIFFSHIKYINNLKSKLDEFHEEYPEDYNAFIGKSIPLFFIFVWLIMAFMPII